MIKATKKAKKTVNMTAAKPVGLMAAYVKALETAGYEFEEEENRLRFTVDGEILLLNADALTPERFSLTGAWMLKKVKYPAEIFESMSQTMLCMPYVRVYSEPVFKKSEITVIFEFCQACTASQVPKLLKKGLAIVREAMEVMGNMR